MSIEMSGHEDETYDADVKDLRCDACEGIASNLYECGRCCRYVCRNCLVGVSMLCVECKAKNEAEAAEKLPPRPPSSLKGTSMKRINWGKSTVPLDLNEAWRNAVVKIDPEEEHRHMKAYWEMRERGRTEQTEREPELIERGFFENECTAAADRMRAGPEGSDSFRQACDEASSRMHGLPPEPVLPDPLYSFEDAPSTDEEDPDESCARMEAESSPFPSTEEGL